jgi:hypothetical protein
VMLSEPGLWLMIAGGVLVAFGFIGFVFSRLSYQVPFQQAEASVELPASDPNKLPSWFSTDKKQFGRADRIEPVRQLRYNRSLSR